MGKTRRILLLGIISMVFMLIISCSQHPDMPKKKIDDMAKNCCITVARKFVYYNSVMRNDIEERTFFMKLNYALNKDHPILVRKMDYEIQKYNKNDKYWPMKINCEIAIEPIAKYEVNVRFVTELEVGAYIYSDEFGHYYAEIAYPNYKMTM